MFRRHPSFASTVLPALSVVLPTFAGASLGVTDPVIACFSAARSSGFSLSDGTEVTLFRQSVLTAFPHSHFQPIGVLTDAGLSGADVVWICVLGNGCCMPITPLSADEQAALLRYVRAGGNAVILTDNDSAVSDEVIDSVLGPFGLAGNNVGGIDGVTVPDPSSSPVTSGRFGNISAFPVYFTSSYTDLGPHAHTLGVLSSNGEPALAVISGGELAPGSGNVTFLADSNPIWDAGLAPSEAATNLMLNALDVRPCAPHITTNPANAVTCGTHGADFTVAASGPGPFTYRWQLETAPDVWTTLGNDPFPLSCGGGAFAAASPFGSASTHLSLHPCAGANRYNIRATVTNSCGAAISNSATLFITSADFNGDGDVGTDQDIEAFFACLAGNCCPTCPPNSDFNGDGDVGTDQDIEAFFRVLAGGTC